MCEYTLLHFRHTFAVIFNRDSWCSAAMAAWRASRSRPHLASRSLYRRRLYSTRTPPRRPALAPQVVFFKQYCFVVLSSEEKGNAPNFLKWAPQSNGWRAPAGPENWLYGTTNWISSVVGRRLELGLRSFSFHSLRRQISSDVGLGGMQAKLQGVMPQRSPWGGSGSGRMGGPESRQRASRSPGQWNGWHGGARSMAHS